MFLFIFYFIIFIYSRIAVRIINSINFFWIENSDQFLVSWIQNFLEKQLIHVFQIYDNLQCL